MPRRILLLVVLSTSAFAQGTLPIPPDVQGAMKELRKERFRAHMAYLADDLLEGRGTGTRGHELAARYTAAQFERLGLLPCGTDGTYYQRVPLFEMSVDAKKSEVFVIRDGAESRLDWGGDFIMLGNPANADSSVEAPVTFVGYGVSLPGHAYDDYSGADVRGRIVAFLDGAPGSLQTELRAHVGANQEKLRVARDHGAIGAIGLRLPESDNLLPWDRVVIGPPFPPCVG